MTNQIEPLHEFTEYLNGECVSFCLWPDGRFTMDGVEKPWYKDQEGKPWIVKKRKNFVSLVKMSIREGDY